MWKLKIADRGEPWTDLGEFETVTHSARKIIDLEGYAVTAVCFKLIIETKVGNEEAAFDYLEPASRETERSYVVKRLRY